MLFANHSLLKDPPFSRLDLIACRNLLIYLDRDLQELACNTFHYALSPDGYLMLGTSESADHPAGQFLDRARRTASAAIARQHVGNARAGRDTNSTAEH